ncbi:hypothetical protein K474DRAFT_84980 [Panus rudis PR-1116 ss-1]|nr:hypothetical protein K474DRAFT_84980 [Panus rudis PR-1116 ss-1]
MQRYKGGIDPSVATLFDATIPMSQLKSHQLVGLEGYFLRPIEEPPLHDGCYECHDGHVRYLSRAPDEVKDRTFVRTTSTQLCLQDMSLNPHWTDNICDITIEGNLHLVINPWTIIPLLLKFTRLEAFNILRCEIRDTSGKQYLGPRTHDEPFRSRVHVLTLHDVKIEGNLMLPLLQWACPNELHLQNVFRMDVDGFDLIRTVLAQSAGFSHPDFHLGCQNLILDQMEHSLPLVNEIINYYPPTHLVLHVRCLGNAVQFIKETAHCLTELHLYLNETSAYKDIITSCPRLTSLYITLPYHPRTGELWLSNIPHIISKLSPQCLTSLFFDIHVYHVGIQAAVPIPRIPWNATRFLTGLASLLRSTNLENIQFKMTLVGDGHTGREQTMPSQLWSKEGWNGSRMDPMYNRPASHRVLPNNDIEWEDSASDSDTADDEEEVVEEDSDDSGMDDEDVGLNPGNIEIDEKEGVDIWREYAEAHEDEERAMQLQDPLPDHEKLQYKMDGKLAEQLKSKILKDLDDISVWFKLGVEVTMELPEHVKCRWSLRQRAQAASSNLRWH